MTPLEGRWKVERVSGLLPPFGVSKVIGADAGWTRIASVPVAPFHVQGTTLRYRWLPVRDELRQTEDGQWLGKGYVLGLRFCRFRLTAFEGARRHRRAAPGKARLPPTTSRSLRAWRGP